MEQLSKHFSLDYLVTGSQRPVTPQSAQQRSPLDEAVILYSESLRSALRAAPKREMRVHDLIKQINQSAPTGSFDQFLNVIRYLQELKFVEIVQEDPIGNHLVRLLR